MFKTRKPTTLVTSIQNPRIDFDYTELVKAAKLLLGKENAEKLIEAAFKGTDSKERQETPSRNEKEFLNLLTHMEYWARHYRDNPEEEAKWEPEERESPEELDAAYYVPKSRAKTKDARSVRNHYVHQFLQIISLRTERSFRLNLPYRLRSEAQRNRLLTNRSEITRNDRAKGTENEYKLRVHLSTKDLPRLASTLGTGQNKLRLTLQPGSTVPNKSMPVEIVWADETPHRPELARQIFGRQTDKLFESGREGLQTMGREERGAILHLVGGNNCRTSFEKKSNGEIEITFEPTVEVKTSGLEAFENEVALMDYLSDQYGCSPAEYFEAVPNIVDALEENLEASARQWLRIPEDSQVSEEDKIAFLREYNEICLTLPTVPTPLGSISVNRMKAWKLAQGKDPDAREKEFQKARNSKEILQGTQEALTQEAPTAPALENPFVQAMELLKEESYSTISSVNPAASLSKEMAEAIAAATIEEINPSLNLENVPERDRPRLERVARSNEAVASALNLSPEELRLRRNLVLENFYQVGVGKNLDAVPEKATFQAYSLTEEGREEFYLDLEHFNQRDFESKGDKPLNADGSEMAKPELAAFIAEKGTVELEIATSPQSLHRMTRYPTGLRSSGKDVSRFPYGHPKHMPRDRGQKNNALQELKVTDFLSAKGQEEWKKILGDGSDEAGRKKLAEIERTIESWSKGYGLILPIRPTSPIDNRTSQWLNSLLRAKKENTPADEKKAQTVNELYFLIKCLSRVAGMKVGGIDTPLQTQPMPSVSSTIPLQLLCGVPAGKIKELKEIHKNPIELRDLEARWENGLMADVFNPLELHKEKEALDAVLNPDPTQQQKACIEAILGQAPDYLKEFNLAIGLSSAGVDNLPAELKPFRPILPLLKSSPLTIRFEGEEMNLATLSEIAAANMTPEVREEFQTLTPEEQGRIELAVQTRALAFKKNLERIAADLNLLSKESEPLKPVGKDIRTLEVPQSESQTKEVDMVSEGLSEALQATEAEEERSGRASEKWLREVGIQLTNPQTATLILQDKDGHEIKLVKNPQGELEITGDAGDNEKLLAAKAFAEALTGKTLEDSDPQKALVEEILAEAKSSEVRTNAKRIQEALQSIPDETGRNTDSRRDLQTAKARIAVLLKMESAEKNLKFQAKNWGHEDTQTGSIELAQVVFDFGHEMEVLTKKAFGTDTEMEPLRKEFLAKFQEPARKVYLSQGEKAVQDYLTRSAEVFFGEEKGRTSKEAGSLLHTIAKELESLAGEITEKGKVRPDSSRKELLEAINSEDGLFHKICAITETNAILAEKLRQAQHKTKELAENPDKTAQKPKDILPLSIKRGTKSPGTLVIEGNTVRTNKIWIKDILESKKGQELLELSHLATAWAAKAEDAGDRRERAALLVYLKTQGIQKEALLSSRTPEGAKALEAAAQTWKKKLQTIYTSGKGSLNQLLAGTATLSAIPADNLLGKETTQTLTKAPAIQEKTPTLKVEITEGPWPETTLKVPSAFLQGEELQEAKRILDKARQEESKKTKIRQIRGAAEVLHGKEAEELGRA